MTADTAQKTGPLIHPTADVHPAAEVGPGTVVHAGVIIGPNVTIGADNTLHPRCIIVRDTTIGDRNEIHPYVVLGGDPQDRAYDPETPGTLVLGSDNILREHVTLHRSTEPGPPTSLGNHNYLMVGTHAGHNCEIGDHNTMSNNTLFAGHVRVGSRNVFSGGVGIHQFCNVGDGSMFQYGAGLSTHCPPFCVYATGVNNLAALNKVGLRRNPDLTDEDRDEVRTVFRAVYRSRKSNPIIDRVEKLQSNQAWGSAAEQFLRFIHDAVNDPDPRRRDRAICQFRRG